MLLELRPEVAAFAQLMERKLRHHDATRGPAGWKRDTPPDLYIHLTEEITEFRDGFRQRHVRAVPELADEAVDVANMLMMIVDVLGGLPGRVPPEEGTAHATGG